MHDLNGIRNIQHTAIVEEYRKAVKAGAVNLAEAIKIANPDLAPQFETIDKVLG